MHFWPIFRKFWIRIIWLAVLFCHLSCKSFSMHRIRQTPLVNLIRILFSTILCGNSSFIRAVIGCSRCSSCSTSTRTPSHHWVVMLSLPFAWSWTVCGVTSINVDAYLQPPYWIYKVWAVWRDPGMLVNPRSAQIPMTRKPVHRPAQCSHRRALVLHPRAKDKMSLLRPSFNMLFASTMTQVWTLMKLNPNWWPYLRVIFQIAPYTVAVHR